MAKTYQDAIPPEGGREYKLTQLPNGNYTIEDVTVYTQEGTPWGASDVNSMLRDINAAMPKSGGYFTGAVVADAGIRAGDYLRNINVKASDGSTNVSTMCVYFTRK